MPSLASDIVGRVKRLPLRPSAQSALMPLFEAVSNSLHALQDRFGDDVAKQGEIEIIVHRHVSGISAGHVSGFTVRDNGIGLTKENYDSFLMPDTQYKLSRGGKGVGRLGWLKVFGDIHVDSHYLDNGAIARRAFKFVLASEDQIRLNDSSAVESQPGTVVVLNEYDGLYGPKCPTRWQTIVERLIGHFLPVFAAGSAPSIRYDDGEEYLELRDYFKEQIVTQVKTPVPITMPDGQSVTLTLRHIKAKKSIRAERTKWHWLFLTANDRAVEEASLDETLGLKALDGEYVYFGCASGEFLNEHVNQERNSFTFDPDENTVIRRSLARAAREFLKDDIQTVLEAKKKVATSVISENPQFIYIQGELSDFVEKLPPNATSSSYKRGGREGCGVQTIRSRRTKGRTGGIRLETQVSSGLAREISWVR
jgi:hypothetical protein